MQFVHNWRLSEQFHQVPNSWTRDPRITNTGFRIISLMLSHDANFVVNKDEMIATLGVSLRTFYKEINKLIGLGILERERERDDETGQLGGIRYWLMPPEEMNNLVEKFSPRRDPLATSTNATKPHVKTYVQPVPLGVTPSRPAQTQQNPTSEPSGNQFHQVPIYRKQKENKKNTMVDFAENRETDAIEKTKNDRDDVRALCDALADRMVANGARRPVISKKWLDSARLLLDRDGIQLRDAFMVLDWCQSDDFWKSNILSMPKFREKFDQLNLRMRGSLSWQTQHPFESSRAGLEWLESGAADSVDFWGSGCESE